MEQAFVSPIVKTAKTAPVIFTGLALLFLFTGCASAPHPSTATRPGKPSITATPMVGIASFYGRQYNGRKTASGETYDMNKMTAAHRTLPFGTRVRVTELSSDRSVVVRINDRGPFTRGRIIDLSLAAAKRLGIVQAGSAKVRVDPAPEATERADLDPQNR